MEIDSIINKNKYTIVLSAIYTPTIHGFTEQSDPSIKEHYLVLDSYYYYTHYNTYYNTTIQKLFKNIKKRYIYYNAIYNSELVQRNNTVARRNYIKPEIAECIILKGGEKVAILKTFWIRLIQRTWKNLCVQKKIIMQKRLHLQNILYWQQRGVWPESCRRFPKLCGMLSYLSI